MSAKVYVFGYEWWCDDCNTGDGGYSDREMAQSAAKAHNEQFHVRRRIREVKK